MATATPTDTQKSLAQKLRGSRGPSGPKTFGHGKITILVDQEGIDLLKSTNGAKVVGRLVKGSKVTDTKVTADFHNDPKLAKMMTGLDLVKWPNPKFEKPVHILKAGQNGVYITLEPVTYEKGSDFDAQFRDYQKKNNGAIPVKLPKVINRTPVADSKRDVGDFTFSGLPATIIDKGVKDGQNGESYRSMVARIYDTTRAVKVENEEQLRAAITDALGTAPFAHPERDRGICLLYPTGEKIEVTFDGRTRTEEKYDRALRWTTNRNEAGEWVTLTTEEAVQAIMDDIGGAVTEMMEANKAAGIKGAFEVMPVYNNVPLGQKLIEKIDAGKVRVSGSQFQIPTDSENPIYGVQYVTGTIRTITKVPMRDAAGEIVYETDEAGNIVEDAEGKPIAKLVDRDTPKVSLISVDFNNYPGKPLLVSGLSTENQRRGRHSATLPTAEAAAADEAQPEAQTDTGEELGVGSDLDADLEAALTAGAGAEDNLDEMLADALEQESDLEP